MEIAQLHTTHQLKCRFACKLFLELLLQAKWSFQPETFRPINNVKGIFYDPMIIMGYTCLSKLSI